MERRRTAKLTPPGPLSVVVLQHGFRSKYEQQTADSREDGREKASRDADEPAGHRRDV
jgi:hypothetical protein